jgi:hypothetical protein
MLKIDQVTSSSICALAYSDGQNLLYVRFKSGRTYRYKEVPQSTFLAFVDAPSKGMHLNSHIKGKFSGELLSEEDAAKVFPVAAKVAHQTTRGHDGWFFLALDRAVVSVDVTI